MRLYTSERWRLNKERERKKTSSRGPELWRVQYDSGVDHFASVSGCNDRFPRSAVRTSVMGFEVVFLVWWVYQKCFPISSLMQPDLSLQCCVICSDVFKTRLQSNSLACITHVQRTTMPVYINICSILSGLIAPLDSYKHIAKLSP